MEENKVKIGKYRHFKGKEYELLDIATDAVNNNAVCIYRALYGEGKIYTRELYDFFSKEDETGTLIKNRPENVTGQETRFEYVTENNKWQVTLNTGEKKVISNEERIELDMDEVIALIKLF